MRGRELHQSIIPGVRLSPSLRPRWREHITKFVTKACDLGLVLWPPWSVFPAVCVLHCFQVIGPPLPYYSVISSQSVASTFLGPPCPQSCSWNPALRAGVVSLTHMLGGAVSSRGSHAGLIYSALPVPLGPCVVCIALIRHLLSFPHLSFSAAHKRPWALTSLSTSVSPWLQQGELVVPLYRNAAPVTPCHVVTLKLL